MKSLLPLSATAGLLLVALAGCGNKPSEGLTISPGQTGTWCSDGTTYHPCKEMAGVSDFTVSNHGPGTVTVTPPTHEAQVYAELWEACKRAHVHYRVHSLDGEGFYGSLYDHGGWPLFIYTDGLTSGPTEAAERLLKLVKGRYAASQAFDTGDVKPR